MKKFLNIINEEINDFVADMNSTQVYYASLSLAEAQRFYGSLVPWELDSNDLKVINKLRGDYFRAKEEMLNKTYNTKLEDSLSNLWNVHIQNVHKALWDKAQTR